MPFSKGHALVIGVGAYQDASHINNVPVAVRDAQAVADILKDPKTCGYLENQVKFIQDAAATRAGVLAALDQLAQNAGQDDTVFIFYCGHGALGDDNQYYLVSHDAQISSGKVVKDTGVSATELINKFAAFQAERVIMIINACYSGNIAPALGVEEESLALDSNPPADATAALLGTGRGRIIITASSEDQKSWIGRGEVKLSYFTQALVDGLRGRGVSNQKGFISAYNLYEYLYTCVSDIVRQEEDRQQDPELTVIKGVGPFAVALFRGSTTLGLFDEKQPAPELPPVRTVDPSEAQRCYQQYTKQTGGVNFGQGNEIHIGGGVAGRDQYNGPVINAQGSTGFINHATGPVTQNFGTQTHDSHNVNTGGGAYIGGNVTVGSGSFIGRDQINYNNQGMNAAEIAAAFAPLFAAIQSSPATNQILAMQKANELKAEAAKGKEANDMKLSELIRDISKAAAPEVVKTLVSLFSGPLLGGVAGPVTKIILDMIQPK